MILSEQKIIQEKGVFYYVYQKIFPRGTYSGGGNGSARCIDGAFLFYGDRAADHRVCGGMGRMPLCDAARGFPDISVKTLSEQRQLLGTCEDEKSVSFCCHPQAE